MTSVIIVTYCSESTIEDCLAGIVLHSPEVGEIICVDNNSADATCELVRRCAALDRRIKLIENSDNLGYAPAINIGARQAQGDVVVLMNPDAIPVGPWLNPILLAISDLSVGAAGPLGDVVGGDMWVGHYVPHSLGDLQSVSRFVTRRFAHQRVETKLLVGFCVAMRKALFDEIGGLDDELILGADDLDLSWRLRIAGYKLIVCKDSFVHHRQGVSFASLEDSTKAKLVAQSDQVLKRKLQRHYGSLTGITSHELWGSDIFAEALAKP